jgi:acyl carrier protein
MSVIDQVRQLLADTLNLPLEAIHEDSATGTLDAWDSLAHVNLMMAVEQHFDIELDVEDFLELTSVTTIAQFVMDQGAG